LKAGLVDTMHLAIAPTLLGWGENLFAGMDLPKLGYRCEGHVEGEKAMHVFVNKS
jgi:dihydrofolate reductase